MLNEKQKYNLEAEKFVYRYKDDPVGFVQDVLGWNPYQKQEDILEAMLEYKQVAVSACHAAGITATLARLGLWWLYTHPNSFVFFSAPTMRQLDNILGREFTEAINRSNYELVYDKPLTSLQPTLNRAITEKWRSFSFSSSPQFYRGYHSDSNLFILDCPGAIHGDTWDLIYDELQQGASVIAAGNATAKHDIKEIKSIEARIIKEGYNKFYKFYKDPETFDMRIDYVDTPNFAGTFPHDNHDKFSQFITGEYVRDVQENHGRHSPIYKNRIRGQFP